MKISVPVISAFIILTLQSCNKNSADPLPEIPTDTAVTFLPTYLSFSDELNPDNGVAVSIKYDLPNRKIEVYTDDSLTTNPYDRLQDIYYYTEKGYLSKWERFNEMSVRIQSFIPERDNNDILKRVLAETTNTRGKDTFNISFSDSAGGCSNYKIMRIDYTYRDQTTGSPFPVFDEYTFLEDRIISVKGGHFPVSNGERNLAHTEYLYNADKKMINSISSNIYGPGQTIGYRYQSAGIGLDSFYHVLQGKDGFYLSTYFRWPTFPNNSFYFAALNPTLYYNGYQKHIDIEAHKDGVLIEVEPIFESTRFAFQNILDSNQRIIESKILENGNLRNVWKARYE